MTTERTLTAVVGLAEGLLARHATYQATEAALAPPLLAAGANSPGGRGTDHADPTANYATALTDNRDPRATTTNNLSEYAADARLALDILRRMQTRQNHVIRQNPDIAREADATLRAIRCDGSIDPLCTRNAVRRGLCWSCYQKARDTDPAPMCGNPTSNVLETATVEVGHQPDPSALAATRAECGRCGWVTAALDVEHAKSLLEEHHLGGCR